MNIFSLKTKPVHAGLLSASFMCVLTNTAVLFLSSSAVFALECIVFLCCALTKDWTSDVHCRCPCVIKN